MYTFILFTFFTTNTEKVHEHQIFLSGRIKYSFVSSTKYESIETESLIHVMVNVRIYFEH